MSCHYQIFSIELKRRRSARKELEDDITNVDDDDDEAEDEDLEEEDVEDAAGMSKTIIPGSQPD